MKWGPQVEENLVVVCLDDDDSAHNIQHHESSQLIAGMWRWKMEEREEQQYVREEQSRQTFHSTYIHM